MVIPKIGTYHFLWSKINGNDVGKSTFECYYALRLHYKDGFRFFLDSHKTGRIIEMHFINDLDKGIYYESLEIANLSLVFLKPGNSLYLNRRLGHRIYPFNEDILRE